MGFRPFPRKEIEALRSRHKYNSIILGSIIGGEGEKGKKITFLLHECPVE